MGRVLLVSLSLLLIGSTARAQVNNADLKWGPAPPGLPAGAQIAVLSGDPGKAGLFTIRLKVPADYTVPPHHHPTDELVTVIDGQMSLGMGDTLDKAKAATLNDAGYIALPANMNHFAFSGSGGTVQITSQGPFEIVYANAKDDPRKK